MADATAVIMGIILHTCALRLAGTVACWGYNFNGQLGDGAPDGHATPASVSELSDATAIAAGSFHTCALRGDGSVACWGRGDRGQLGSLSAIPFTFEPHLSCGRSARAESGCRLAR